MLENFNDESDFSVILEQRHRKYLHILNRFNLQNLNKNHKLRSFDNGL
jgi:hypothetical protein